MSGRSTAVKRGLHRRRWAFYYDGSCGFCAGLVRWLSRIDFFGQITWIPYQALEKPPRGLSWGDLDRAAYLGDPAQGRLYEGFYAFRMLALKLFPLIPLAPLFWFPGVHVVGVTIYRWVARNRYHLSSCRLPGLKTAQQTASASDPVVEDAQRPTGHDAGK